MKRAKAVFGQPRGVIGVAAAILIMIFMISGLIEWMGLDQMSYLHYDFAFFYYAFHLV
nr:hypothetical protein [Bacilli bacterium]